MPKSGIILRFTLEGFHHYPDAPKPVEFLSARHRHLFYFEVYFAVSHENRDLEFFITAAKVKNALTKTYGNPCEFGAMSCESIAQFILKSLQTRGCHRVEVWEDNENGAFVES